MLSRTTSGGLGTNSTIVHVSFADSLAKLSWSFSTSNQFWSQYSDLSFIFRHGSANDFFSVSYLLHWLDSIKLLYPISVHSSANRFRLEYANCSAILLSISIFSSFILQFSIQVYDGFRYSIMQYVFSHSCKDCWGSSVMMIILLLLYLSMFYYFL